MSKASCIKKISSFLCTTDKNSEKLYTSSFKSGEFFQESGFEDWFQHRLKENIVFLDKSDYEEMCLSSLKALKNFPGTS